MSSPSRFWSGLRVRAALGFGITGLIVAVAGASLTFAFPTKASCAVAARRSI